MDIPNKKPIAYNNINELVSYYFEPIGNVKGGNINWTLMCSVRMSEIFNVAVASNKLTPKNRQRILDWFDLMREKTKI